LSGGSPGRNQNRGHGQGGQLAVAVYVSEIVHCGTVEQLVNVVEAVRTVRFQVLLWLLDRRVTVAMELPGSEGESGSVAWKVMVAGVAVMAVTLSGGSGGRMSPRVARGFGVRGAFCPAPAANNTAMDSHPLMGFRLR
jgi:hypothetical protein